MKALCERVWRELTLRKGRLVVVVASYALATAVFIILVSLREFAVHHAPALSAGTETGFVSVTPACVPHCERKTHDPKNEDFIFHDMSVVPLYLNVLPDLRRIREIEDIAPYLQFRFRDPAGGAAFLVGGIDLRHLPAVEATVCSPAAVPKGRFLKPDDTGKVMVELGYATTRGIKVGDTLRIAGEPFTVCGIIDVGTRPVRADLVVTYADALRIINTRVLEPLKDGQTTALLVKARSVAVLPKAIREFRTAWPGGLIVGYGVLQPEIQVAGLNDAALPVIVLLLFLYALAMGWSMGYFTVRERLPAFRQEQAAGRRGGGLFGVLLLESMMQGALGGLIGCLTAAFVLVMTPIKAWTSMPTSQAPVVLAPLLFGAGLLLPVLCSLLTGLFTAGMGAHVRPADVVAIESVPVAE